MNDLFLPSGYIERSNFVYHDDVSLLDAGIVFQPEIYPVAENFMLASGRRKIIDIGCGAGKKLAMSIAQEKLGVDFGSNIDFCKTEWKSAADWYVADLERPLDQSLLDTIGKNDVVICSDVIEHLHNPRHLLAALRRSFEQGALVITSTPDRSLVRGEADRGPPANEAHVREWSIDEYGAMLALHGLPSFFLGYTYNNDRDRFLRTIVSVHEPRLQLGVTHCIQRPLAIVSSFNEADVIRETVIDLVKQGCDVHAIDNWSTDATWDLLQRLQVELGRHLIIERYPDAQSYTASWHQILSRKEAIAACHKGRWIVHSDADELRRGFGPDARLSDSLAATECAGWNRLDFSLLNFRPIDERPFVPGTLSSHFRHFEFGSRPGHFLQKKAWLQGAQRVRLADSGGHVADFEGALAGC